MDTQELNLKDVELSLQTKEILKGHEVRVRELNGVEWYFAEDLIRFFDLSKLDKKYTFDAVLLGDNKITTLIKKSYFIFIHVSSG